MVCYISKQSLAAVWMNKNLPESLKKTSLMKMMKKHQLLRTKGLATHQMMQGLLMCASEPAGLAVGSYCVALDAVLVMLEELEWRQIWKQCLCLELDYLGQLIAIGVLRDSNYYMGELGKYKAKNKAERGFYMVVVYMATFKLIDPLI